MAPNIRFSYFDLKARGEYSRFILAYAGVDYEDDRVKQEEWPIRKGRTPFGFLPILNYDGKEVSGSIGIARFLAREFNIAGKDSWEMAEADEIVDQVVDLFNHKFKLMFEPDKAKQKAGLEDLAKVKVPGIVKSMEKILVKRGGQFLVGNSLTWADLMVYYLASEMTEGSKKLKDAPALANLVDRVGNLPNIKAWVKSRPTGSMPF